MAVFTSKEGIEYAVQEAFRTPNMLVLSEDLKAFPVWREDLDNLSMIREEMFPENVDGTYSETVRVPLNAAPLRIFIAVTIWPGVLPVGAKNWDSVMPAIAFAREHQCLSVARDILYAYSSFDPGHLRIEAFIAACDANHLQAACRILSVAHSGEQSKGQSLRPVGGGWEPAQVARVSSLWLWALANAVAVADSRMLGGHGAAQQRLTREYWSAVIGEFMIHLIKCTSQGKVV